MFIEVHFAIENTIHIYHINDFVRMETAIESCLFLELHFLSFFKKSYSNMLISLILSTITTQFAK
jgi:hypothetical protein